MQLTKWLPVLIIAVLGGIAGLAGYIAQIKARHDEGGKVWWLCTISLVFLVVATLCTLIYARWGWHRKLDEESQGAGRFAQHIILCIFILTIISCAVGVFGLVMGGFGLGGSSYKTRRIFIIIGMCGCIIQAIAPPLYYVALRLETGNLE